MVDPEVEKSQAFKILETVDYVPHSIIFKTIYKKITGSVTAISMDAGEILREKISPFDTLVYAIDGKAEIVIDGTSHWLEIGQSIIIPAHLRNTLKPLFLSK